MTGHELRVTRTGPEARNAAGLLILVHGRGASARDILSLAPRMHSDGFAYWAPQASNGAWYPQSFLAPVSENEPWLSSALSVLAMLVAEAGTQGVRPERIWFAGFSQGACLCLEFLARNAARWGGVAAFSGGLIGDQLLRERYGGDLAGTPVFLGSSDPDPYIPVPRVHESAGLLESIGASVKMTLYPDMGHTISEEEIAEANLHIFPTA
jgi:phospholipase/carboxylesterase